MKLRLVIGMGLNSFTDSTLVCCLEERANVLSLGEWVKISPASLKKAYMLRGRWKWKR
jgi:hypothetical protein